MLEYVENFELCTVKLSGRGLNWDILPSWVWRCWGKSGKT